MPTTNFPVRVDHLRSVQIPEAEDRAKVLTTRVRSLDESLMRVASEPRASPCGDQHRRTSGRAAVKPRLPTRQSLPR